MESLLLMISWKWVALTFDTIRKISTFSDGRWQGCVIEFVNPDCHPLRVMSKSKHFPELSKTLRPLTIKFIFRAFSFSTTSNIKMYFSSEPPAPALVSRALSPFFSSIQMFRRMLSMGKIYFFANSFIRKLNL